MKKNLAWLLLLVSTIAAADTFTNRLNLDLPIQGSYGWGTKLNNNFQILDATITASGTLVAGSGITLTVGSGQTTISATGGGGGGGASTLAVSTSGVVVSSPTSQIDLIAPIKARLIGTTTAQFFLDTSSVTMLGAAPTTTNIPEGTNQYFTNARATAAASATNPLVDTNGVFSIAASTFTLGGNLVGGSNITVAPGVGVTTISFSGSISSVQVASITTNISLLETVNQSTVTLSINPSSGTLQGNTFNGNNQLVQTGASGLIGNSNVDGSSVTKMGILTSANSTLTIAQGVGFTTFTVTLPAVAISSVGVTYPVTETVTGSTVTIGVSGSSVTLGGVLVGQGLISVSPGVGVTTITFNSSIPTIQVASITTNASLLETVNAATVTLSVNPSSGTLQGNTFNGNNQLLQLGGTGLVPNANVDGSSITKMGILVAGANITIAQGVGVTTITASSGGGTVAVSSVTNVDGSIIVQYAVSTVTVSVSTSSNYTWAGSHIFNSTVTANNVKFVGIGSTTPINAANNFLQIGVSTTVAFTNNGHWEFHQSTSPTVSSCGTGGPTTSNSGSTDNRGSVTTGTLATACTVTFVNSFTNSPICQVTGSSTVSFPGITSVSNTAITFGISASVNNDILYWTCDGTQ